MTTFKLDSTNNLQFESNFETLSKNEALIQDIRTLLLMFRGEYPFNSDLGIDYYALMQNNDRNELLNAIFDRIKGDSRVKTIKNSNVDFKNGKLELTCEILTSWGEVINV